MGSRNPERDRPPLSPGMPLSELVDRYSGWLLEAACYRCLRAKYLLPGRLVERYGPELTIGELERRLTCRRCGRSGVQLHARYARERR